MLPSRVTIDRPQADMKRLLVIFPGALGDLICAGPAIAALARMNSASMPELMARADLADFAAGRMGVVRGYSIDRPEVSALFREDAEPSEAARKFFSQFDKICSFFASHDDNFRRMLKGASSGEVIFYPFRPEGRGHITDLYLAAVGADHAYPDFRIDPLESDRAAARQILARFGMDPHGYVLVLPGSGSRTKNWPGFPAMVSRMRGRTRPLVVLGPAESAIEHQYPAAATASGLAIGTVAALASEATAFVGNDSGVSHLAATAAAGVVIFGPTDATRWAPRGRVEVISARCLQAVGVEPVLNAIDGLCAQAARCLR